MNSVRYQLDIIDIAAHLISVTLSFEPTDETHLLTLPAWIPGSYMIRDFARNIVSIEASDSSGLLNLVQQDKQSWLLGCQNKRVTVVYQLYAYDLSVRAAYIDDDAIGGSNSLVRGSKQQSTDDQGEETARTIQ